MVGTVNIENNDTNIVDLVLKEKNLVEKVYSWLTSSNRLREQRHFYLGNLPVYEGKDKYVRAFNDSLSFVDWSNKINGSVVDINHGMSLNMLQTSKKYRCKKSGLEYIGKKWFNRIFRRY